MPVGSVIAWPLDVMPGGSDNNKWLECNGQTIDSIAYPKLALLMSNTPNYQGIFLRGYGSQSYTDSYGTVIHSSEELNIIQGDVIRNITGKTTMGTVEDTGNPFHGVFYNSGTFSGAGSGWTDYGLGFDASLVVPTGNENRPINKAVKYLIKAK